MRMYHRFLYDTACSAVKLTPVPNERNRLGSTTRQLIQLRYIAKCNRLVLLNQYKCKVRSAVSTIMTSMASAICSVTDTKYV